MSKSDYIPPGDAAFLVWHDNFKSQAHSIGATLGITAAELAVIDSTNQALHEAMEALADLAGRRQQATAEKKAARDEAEEQARRLAKDIKNHPAYNTGYGEQLDIEGPEDTTDLAAAQPKLKGKPQGHGLIELTFNKSKSDGVNIYSQREGETSFTFLARDTNSPYIDNRPCMVMGKAETRRYKAKYVVDDQEVGYFSDEVPVLCEP